MRRGGASQWGAAWRLAVREGRHGFRRIGPYMAAITIGVAALVSIHSFRDDVARSFQREADAGTTIRYCADATLRRVLVVAGAPSANA